VISARISRPFCSDRFFQKRTQRRHGELFTIDDFYRANPLKSLISSLASRNFSRGLPQSTEITERPEVAETFRRLLKEGIIYVEGQTEPEAFQICQRNGWIHSDLIQTSTSPKFRYIFPSYLHTACLSWRLTPASGPPPCNSLFGMAVTVINRFKPSQMYIPIRRVDAEPEDPPEAQYQDEFYRSIHSVHGGAVLISPEFASAKKAEVVGRIDFFVSVRAGE
jgi:hypothetical protein